MAAGAEKNMTKKITRQEKQTKIKINKFKIQKADATKDTDKAALKQQISDIRKHLRDVKARANQNIRKAKDKWGKKKSAAQKGIRSFKRKEEKVEARKRKNLERE